MSDLSREEVDDAEVQAVIDAMSSPTRSFFESTGEFLGEHAGRVAEGARLTAGDPYAAGQAALAAVSVADPTMASDVASAALYKLEGDDEAAAIAIAAGLGGLGAGALAAKLWKMRQAHKAAMKAKGLSDEVAELMASETAARAEALARRGSTIDPVTRHGRKPDLDPEYEFGRESWRDHFATEDEWLDHLGVEKGWTERYALGEQHPLQPEEYAKAIEEKWQRQQRLARRMYPESYPKSQGLLDAERARFDARIGAQRGSSRREQLFHELFPGRKNSSLKDIHAESDAARKAGDYDKADALDDIANHLDIQIDMTRSEKRYMRQVAIDPEFTGDTERYALGMETPEEELLARGMRSPAVQRKEWLDDVAGEYQGFIDPQTRTYLEGATRFKGGPDPVEFFDTLDDATLRQMDEFAKQGKHTEGHKLFVSKYKERHGDYPFTDDAELFARGMTKPAPEGQKYSYEQGLNPEDVYPSAFLDEAFPIKGRVSLGSVPKTNAEARLRVGLSDYLTDDPFSNRKLITALKNDDWAAVDDVLRDVETPQWAIDDLRNVRAAGTGAHMRELSMDEADELIRSVERSIDRRGIEY